MSSPNCFAVVFVWETYRSAFSRAERMWGRSWNRPARPKKVVTPSHHSGQFSGFRLLEGLNPRVNEIVGSIVWSACAIVGRGASR